jgi:hypothetical protein
VNPEDVEQAVLRRWPGFRGSERDLDRWLGLPEGTTARVLAANTSRKKEGP